MEIICSCGNSFDFGEPENVTNGQMKGFEFATSENDDGEELLFIHCMNCDKTICMYE